MHTARRSGSFTHLLKGVSCEDITITEVKITPLTYQPSDRLDIIIGSENALPAYQQLEMIEDVGNVHFMIYFDTRNLFSMRG